MGLDRVVCDKPRPGREEEFLRLKAILRRREFTPEEEALYREVAITPYDTLGVPRVGIDEAATRYLLEAAAERRREIAQNPHLLEEDPEARQWQLSDEELVQRHYGAYVPDLVEYQLSPYQVMAPFVSLAGHFSFRGQVLVGSPLLNKRLQRRAFQSMTSQEMAEYAVALEKCAIPKAARALSDLGCGELAATLLAGPAQAFQWAEESLQAMRRRAEAEGFQETIIGYRSADGREFEPTPMERLASQLHRILAAARWLRFWADLGHSMYAWY